MRIERTYDSDLVRAVLSHPAIAPFIVDDKSPDPDWADVVCNPALYFLRPMTADRVGMGLFVLHPVNGVTLEIHTAILPEHRGRAAYQAAKLLLQWVVENTTAQKLITHVPAFNTAALRYAQAAGMVIEGCNRASFLKDSVLYDQHLLGITRREICQQ